MNITSVNLCYVIFQVTNYLQEIAPDLCDRVELYDKRIPLFSEFNIEEEIDNILSKRWGLVSIAYVVNFHIS
jgi:Ribonuclease G/E